MKVIDDRYQVIELVDRRERSELYRVEDRLRPGRVLMLKILLPSSKEEREAFANDFRVRASLRHRGVARVYELGIDPETDAPYYTGEWIGGQAWDDVAPYADGSLLYQLCADVCSTLEYCHGRGLLHLDLKPDNLLVIEERGELRAKVLDFGLAQGRSRHGVPGGTPIFMAPELLEGRAYDRRADLFSLGLSMLPPDRRPDVPGKPGSIPSRWPRPLVTLVRRLTESDPDVRFASAQAVLRYLERTAAVPAPFLRELLESESPFVGRDVAVMRLREAFRRRFDGAAVRPDPDAAAAVVIVGEPGAGKTRLMREFRAAVTTLPPVVVGGDPYGEDVPCLPLGDPLARLWQRREIREGPGQRTGRALAALLPGLKPRPEPTGREPSGQADLVKVITDFLVEAGHQRPGTLFLDDLDRGDPIGRAVLAALLERPDNPWFVVTTARSLGDLPRCERLVLDGLDAEAVGSLLRWRFDEAAIDPQLAARVRRITGGNPAFLEVLAHQLQLVPQAVGPAVLSLPEVGELKTPADLAAAIHQRQGALSDAQKAPLGFLALASRSIPLDNICLALGRDESELGTTLDELVDQGLVRREGRGAGARYLFAAEHHAAATCDALSPEERQRYHAAMARLLGHADDVEDLLDLARHLAQSGEPARAAGVLLRAATRARARFEPEVAESALRRAASVAPDGETGLRIEAGLALGDLLVRQGRYRAADDAYHDVERLAHSEGDPFTLGRLAMQQGVLALKNGEKALGLSLFERAAGALEGQASSGEMAAAYARIAESYMWEDSEAARRYCDMAMSKVAEDAPAQEMSALHLLSGQLAALSGDYRTGVEDVKTAADASRESNDPTDEMVAMNVLAGMHLDLGEVKEGLALSRRALDLAQETGERDQFARVAIGHADALTMAGEYADAHKRYRQALEQAAAIGHQLQESLARMHLGRLLGRLGAPDEAQAELERAALLADAVKDRGAAGESRVWLAVVRFRASETEGLEKLLDRAERDLRPVRLKRGLDAVWMVRAALLLRRGLYDEADAALRALGDGDLLPEAECTVLRLRSRLERVRRDGDLPAAYGHARQALSIAERIGNPDAHWRSLEELASVCVGLQERDQGVDTLRQLQELAQRVEANMPPEVEASHRIHRAIGRLARELGVGVLPKSATAGETGDPRLSSLLGVLRSLTEELPTQTHLMHLLQVAVDQTAAERGMIRLGGSDAGPEDVKELFIADAFPTSEQLLDGVLRTGQVTWTANAAEDPRFADRDSVLAHQLRSVLCAPLRLGDRVEGVLYVDHPFQDAAFGPGDLAVIEGLASLAGLLAQGARLTEEGRRLRSDVARLKELGHDESVERPAAPHTTVLHADVQRGQLKYGYEEIVGQHPALVLALQTVDHIVDTEIPVYIHGESGTGKELFARAVHFNGPRADEPFLALNCAAVPEQLMESELFGHVRGAFTGATADRKGLFEMAHKGTLFLDEVADMSPAMQARLLRVLQEGEVRRVGSTRIDRVDVRVLAASHRDLAALVETGEFRQDVFYRLCAITVKIPPLRDRREDIPLLLQAFLGEEAQERKAAMPTIDPQVLELLGQLDWPGNVRQLRNVVRTAWALGGGHSITCQEVAMALGRPELAAGPSPSARPSEAQPTTWSFGPPPDAFGPTKEEREREALLSALRQSEGNKVKAAKLLGISRRTLYRKMERLGLDKD